MLLLPHAAALLPLDRAPGTCLNRLPDAGRPWRARVPAATLLLCRNTDRRYLPEAVAQRARDKFPAGLTGGTDHTDRLHPALHPNSVAAISSRQCVALQTAFTCAQYPC